MCNDIMAFGAKAADARTAGQQASSKAKRRQADADNFIPQAIPGLRSRKGAEIKVGLSQCANVRRIQTLRRAKPGLWWIQ